MLLVQTKHTHNARHSPPCVSLTPAATSDPVPPRWLPRQVPPSSSPAASQQPPSSPPAASQQPPSSLQQPPSVWEGSGRSLALLLARRSDARAQHPAQTLNLIFMEQPQLAEIAAHLLEFRSNSKKKTPKQTSQTHVHAHRGVARRGLGREGKQMGHLIQGTN